jgi:hypothetical protein
MSKQFSAFEKHREAVRELEFRRQVYKRMVGNAKLSSDVANRRIALMQEIADDYRDLSEKERLL